MVGASVKTRRWLTCLKCLCCGWTWCTKLIIIFLYGGSLVLSILANYQKGGIGFIYQFSLNLALDWFGFGFILSTCLFSCLWGQEMKGRDSGGDWSDNARLKKQIVTVHDFLSIKEGKGKLPLPAPTPAFQKFQNKYTVSQIHLSPRTSQWAETDARFV